jgi:Na+/H+ antiporter NhaD/arsenite permease-like protein
VVNLAPVVLLTAPAVLAVLYLMFRKESTRSKDAEETIGAMDAAASIRDPILLRKSLIVLGVVITFVLEDTA